MTTTNRNNPAPRFRPPVLISAFVLGPVFQSRSRSSSHIRSRTRFPVPLSFSLSHLLFISHPLFILHPRSVSQLIVTPVSTYIRPLHIGMHTKHCSMCHYALAHAVLLFLNYTGGDSIGGSQGVHPNLTFFFFATAIDQGMASVNQRSQYLKQP